MMWAISASVAPQKIWAAGDRSLRRRRLDHRVATTPAGIFGRVDDLDLELGRDDVEHLVDLFPDRVKSPLTTGASLVLKVHRDIDPRQMGGQGPPVALGRPASRLMLGLVGT